MSTENETTVIEITDLEQDDLNANLGTQRGEDMLEDSLTRHGAGRSILVDKNNKIIAGNKTAIAAAKAGITKVRVIDTVGDEVVAVRRVDLDLDSADARELAILDNRTAQVNLEWSGEALEKLEESGVSLTSAFFEDELDRIIARSTATEKGGGAGGAGAAPGASPAVSAVRMVQLYFDNETFDRFNEVIELLENRLRTKDTVETIIQAMRLVLMNSTATTAPTGEAEAS